MRLTLQGGTPPPDGLLWRTLSRGFDQIDSTHVRAEGFWDHHGSVTSLVVFQYRDQSTPNSQSRPIQGMNVFRFTRTLTPELDIRASSLKGFRICLLYTSDAADE